MRRRNNASLPTFLLLTSLFLTGFHARGGAQSQPSAAPGSVATQPPVTQPPTTNDAQSGDPAKAASSFSASKSKRFAHATVIDDKQHIVTNLAKGDFSVFEDGHPQTITSFQHEDVPVAMGSW